MPATIHDHFINKSLLASLDAQAESDPHVASFTAFPNTTTTRPRYYPSQDPFPITSPVIHHHNPYDRSALDYHHQQPLNRSPYLLDPYAQPKPSTSQQQQQPPQQQQPQQSPYPPFSNGVQLASQTPYGPHVPTSAPSAPVNLSMSANAGQSSTTANGEEISTIFVVGFPEDMQEREFQNMFTFSPGFEAATLKIPNKEYTAYNALMGGPQSLQSNAIPQPRNYSASNDPYNLVTVNQGGVLVDAGRDGVMSSWPAPPPTDDLAAHYAAANGLNGPNGSTSILPPRKQIIGFAKFRTREEALTARDVLQGRRVDIEKGAVLKAEMAKKNLHTKRGVGPVPGTASAIGPVGTVLGVVPPGGALGPPGSSSNPHEQPHFGDPYGGIIGNQRVVKNGSGDSDGFMRGARARAEEDEMLRERGMSVSSMGIDGLTAHPSKDSERERMMRLRASNSAAFDAFHSVASGPTSSSSGLPGTSPLVSATGVGVPTAVSRQSSTASATASISSAGSLSGSGMWTSPTTVGSEARSLNSVMEKEGEDEDDTFREGHFGKSLNDDADGVHDSERFRQEGARKDTLDFQESNNDDSAQNAQSHDEPHEHLNHQLVNEAQDNNGSIERIAEAIEDLHLAELAIGTDADVSDRRQSQSGAHSHSTTLEHEQEHNPENDEIVDPWDRITPNHASQLGGDKYTASNQRAAGTINGKLHNAPSVPSYAAVAAVQRQSMNVAPGPASGSERSISPTGFSDTQHNSNGFHHQSPPTKFMNQYQHLQYHNDLHAQRLAQQKQHQNAFGWPSFQQQQWGSQQDPQHFRSNQSESSETSAIGGISPETHGPGPIGYVGAVSISSAIASRAGLGLGVNTGVSHFGTLSNMASEDSSVPATRVVNGIERLEDITNPISSSLSSSTSSHPSMSGAAVDGVANGVNGSSPLPPPSSASSTMSTASSGSQGPNNGAPATTGSSGNISPQLPSPASGSTTSASSSSGLRGTVDQNPPINTLYVGNLPTSPPPLGMPNDYLEETLREVFAARPGFRKLCFRHKANGPMCFVEFEDVAFASKALREMAGDTLRGIVKHGIRLSYSKNPLGVRTPTSAGGSGPSGGPTPLQSQQLMQTLSNHHMYQHHQQSSSGSIGHGSQDSFVSRLPDEFTGHTHNRMPPIIMRRDSTLSPTSPGHGYGGMNGNGGSFFSSPPPRFYTTSPGTNIAFGPASGPSSPPLTSASNAFVPRGSAGLNGNGMPPGMYNTGNNGMGAGFQGGFSPFGMPFDNGSFAPQVPQHQQQPFMGVQQHSMPDGQQQHHQQGEE